jgi:uncharacterized protein YjbI with pentapeptide repeats
MKQRASSTCEQVRRDPRDHSESDGPYPSHGIRQTLSRLIRTVVGRRALGRIRGLDGFTSDSPVIPPRRPRDVDYYPPSQRCQSVSMGEGSSIYRAAERRLLDAIGARTGCDFADGANITAADMASWGPERTIRATLLRRLLTAENAEYAADGVHLRGAAVEGMLDLTGMKVMNLDLEQCRLTTAKASGATFTGATSFGGATFTGDAAFNSATFTGVTSFGGATFTGATSFGGATFMGDAAFNSATFTGDAWFGATFTGAAGFGGATFTRNAWFGGATFTGATSFGGATFTGAAGFGSATFTSDAAFESATFTSDASFESATFTSDASFERATFTGDASFGGATFTSDASFSEATFTSDASFTGALADAYDFNRAQFHTTDPGPWVAPRVVFTGTVFHVPARVAIAADEVDCRRLQAREGVHLIVRGGVVDLEDAELLRRSILEHSALEPEIPQREKPGERPEGFDQLLPAARARWAAKRKSFQFAQQLADELNPGQAKRTRVVSLRRAAAGDLVLSGVGLGDCAFAGAHGLDKLRIDATCSFQRPPAWPSRTWRLFTGRQVIFEETQWRHTNTPGWARTSTTPTASAKVPTALEIAGIYRDLRKGLEDAKDEPGAADFYYGETEMRRLAARGSRHRRNDNGGSAKGRRPSWTERRLLDAYWTVSGYGLRAWRAMAALTILLVGCAVLFTLPAFTYLPDSPQHVSSVNLATGALRYKLGAPPGDKPDTSTTVTFAKSLEFTARESLTLTRASGDPLLRTTGAGTALDIALRLLAPLLLGLAVLAVRGRTKR